MKVLILSLLFSQALFAKVERIKFNVGPEDHYINAYSENNKFILDHFKVEPGRLQKLVSRKYFASLKKLNLALGPYKKNNKKLFRQRNSTQTEISTQVVWKAINTWDLQWERKFAQWHIDNFDENFFVKYNLSTDCADVAFALRWIFARINSLPAANTLAGSHIIFSNESFKQEWSHLKRSNKWFEDEVFLAALNYLKLHAFTGTLNIDGYPIELNKDSFLTGTIHLDGGHTMIISAIDYKGKLSAPIWKLSSTVPMQVRVLAKEIMVDQAITNEQDGGLFRMRWPVKKAGKWELIPKEDMPLYSKEQYSSDFLNGQDSFAIALINKLGINFDPENILKETVTNIKNSLQSRVSIVESGFNFCNVNDCSEGTINYEEHSTPTRDGRLRKLFKTAHSLAKDFSSFDAAIVEKLQTMLETNSFTVNGTTKSLKDWEFLLNYYALSYHPEDSIDERWATTKNAIEQTYLNRFNTFMGKRNKAVTAASICRTSPQQCSPESVNFAIHNTFELDKKFLTQVYSGFVRLKATINLANINGISSIPFLKSDPRLSIQKRHAQDLDYTNYKTLAVNGNNIIELKDDIFLVDNEIIDYSSGATLRVFPKGNIIVYKSSQKILRYTKNMVELYDFNGKLIDTKSMSDILSATTISENFIAFITESNQTTIEYQIIELEAGLTTLEQAMYYDGITTRTSNGPIVFENEVVFYARDYNTSKSFYYYDNKGILESKNIEANSVAVKDKYLYALTSSDLKVFDIEESTSCHYKLTKNYNWIDLTSQRSNLVTLSSNDYMLLLENDNCALTKLLDVAGYLNVYDHQNETIISHSGNADPSQTYYIYRNNSLIKIPGKNSYLGRVYKDYAYYAIYGNDNSVKEQYKVNLNTQKITKLSTDSVYYTCSPWSSECKFLDPKVYSLFSLSKKDQKRHILEKVLIGNKHLFSRYSEIHENTVIYHNNEVSINNYNSYRVSENLMLLFKEKP